MPRKARYDYGSDWKVVRAEVLERDGFRCWSCGEPATSVDHIVPVAEARHLRLVRSNLRAACSKHNEGRVVPRLAKMASINRAPAKVRAW